MIELRLLSVLTSYLSLQVATEIGIGSFLLSELLPALRNIFASIAAASVVYEVIDQVYVIILATKNYIIIF